MNLTAEESEGLIKFLAEKRGITTKKLLSTIKLNLKRKNNKDLASKSQQKLIKSIKSQQKLAKTQLELLKTQQKLIKSIKTQQKLTKQTKSQGELIKSQRKTKKQQTRKIRNSFYNIDKKINNNFIEDKLDKKINNNNTNDDFIENIRDLFNNKLDEKINNNTNDDFIENIRDLFSILDYEPLLIKTGFDNNYLEYMSNGNNSLSFNEYLELIKPYLFDLINVYKAKGEWKLQLSAEISFVSQKPDSNEMRIMYTRSTPEEIIMVVKQKKSLKNLLCKYYKNTRIIYKIK